MPLPSVCSKRILRHSSMGFTAVAITVLLAACGTPGDTKVTPVTIPSARGFSVDVHGVVVTANAFADPAQAQAAFGFDVRAAGLFPVRLSFENKSQAVVNIRPEQTFLIDTMGQAWPMLTQSQAYNRINNALEQGKISLDQSVATKVYRAASSTVGYAMGILMGRDVAGRPIRCFSVDAGLAQDDACYMIENQLRKDLAGKGLKNLRVHPGELAYGVLFFPGRDEASSARSLRLTLDLDGYPEVVSVPVR